MARYSLSSSDLPTSIAGMVFRTRVTSPPLCRSALSCRKSSYPLRVKRWASVRWVSWMQMMSTPTLFRNTCSSGFFFRSPSAFHCAKTSGTADVSGWLDKQFACCLLFSSWFALPVAAGGPLWGWGPGTVTAWYSTGQAPYRRMSVCMAMLGKVRSDWSSPGLVTLQEVCPLSSAITSDFWAAHGLSLECPSPRLVASTSYRVQSTRPVAPGWEYTWPTGHMDLLRPGRWLRLAAHPPNGAVWTPPPHEVQPASWGGLPGCGAWSQHVRDSGDGWKPGLPVHPTR